jgi:DNA-binding MarR family transcriptional regulator
MPMILLKEVPKFECLLERSKTYPDLDPSAMEAFMHFLTTGTAVFEELNAMHSRHNISEGRFGVMVLLNRDLDKPKNPAELADCAQVTRATMTGLIDTLERDGFVKREHAPDDRRMMLVQLTTKGCDFLESILPIYFRRVNSVMSRLTVPERKQLVALMSKIQQGLRATSPDAASGAPAT